MNGMTSYILSKKYVESTVDSLGSLKGAPCTIKSQTETDDSYIITFEWTGTSGVTETSQLTIKKPKDGIDGLPGKDGKTPTITIGTNNNWFINGIDTGINAKGEKGETGSGFKITRQYTSVSDMMSDSSPANDSEVVVVISNDLGTFYLRLSSYVDPDGVTNGYLPIGSAQDISTIKGDPGKDGKDGLTPHIDSATKHWFIGTTDTGILAEGKNGSDGVTPHIGSNNHWFIGDTDTGVMAQGVDGADGKDGVDGADGRSITSITKDNDDNIIVTFSDGTTQNIGKLSVDIQGDFLTSGGFGNLRYYNGHFQYYDSSTSTWIDTSITPDNVYIMNMIPQTMKKIVGVYDVDLGKYKLKWEEPDDTVIDGQVACIVDKVIIRRKLNSIPINETDGDLVIEVKRKDFNSHKNEYFIDQALTPNNGDIYYYKAFPVSTTGFYNYSTLNETSGIITKDYVLYGFKLNQNESDPANMITYIEDNKDFESAHMDYTADTFKYGDWSDAWFIKNLKPCMLKYDGTIDYELDKDDYSKKLDGTPSDVANTSYEGNAMIGFPKVYWKVVDNGDDTANIYFSDKKVDSDFHCWSHIDNNGNEIDYCYMPIFNGSLVDGRLRSLSGRTPIASKTASDEINYAKANNVGSDVIWYTELINDRMLVNLLLLLIGKSTDTQVVFGAGNNNSYVSPSNTGVKNTGTMNTKGLFWGNQDNVSGVKVFGIEHWYGNIWRRIGGWINDKGTQKIKMTYGQSDGSTTDGYNETGSGYISIGGATPSGTSGGYISKMMITDNGLIPTISRGSATTYYCDGLWFNNSQVNYVSVGGRHDSDSLVGALYSVLSDVSSVANWGVGASISCKPLAKSS